MSTYACQRAGLQQRSGGDLGAGASLNGGLSYSAGEQGQKVLTTRDFTS